MAKRKSKPAWLVFLALLWALVAPGCGWQPEHKSYSEATVAYDTATTPEEKESAKLSLAYYEDMLEKADAYLNWRRQCHAATTTQDVMWACGGDEFYNERRPPETIDQKIKVYRRDRHTCGCAKKSDLLSKLGL